MNTHQPIVHAAAGYGRPYEPARLRAFVATGCGGEATKYGLVVASAGDTIHYKSSGLVEGDETAALGRVFSEAAAYASARGEPAFGIGLRRVSDIREHQQRARAYLNVARAAAGAADDDLRVADLIAVKDAWKHSPQMGSYVPMVLAERLAGQARKPLSSAVGLRRAAAAGALARAYDLLVSRNRPSRSRLPAGAGLTSTTSTSPASGRIL